MTADKPRNNLPAATRGGEATFTPARMAAIGLLTAAFVAVFWRWFVTQHRYSSEFLQDWGHAYIVPGIAVYMVHRAWGDIIRTPTATFAPGLLAMATGIVSYFFFVAGFPNHMGQGLSMIVALFGLLLYSLGPAMMRRLFLPTAYLVFGITISEAIMIMVTFKLQNLSAWGGYYLLLLLSPIFGYVVSLTGNSIEIVTSNGTPIPLGIAEACSGMRMVVAFLALAGAVGLMSCRWWWQRAAVMLLAVPVAVAMNLVRIAVLGLLSLWDPKLASGDAHIFIGTVLLVPALGLFMAAVWSLDRIWIPGEGATAPAPRPGPVVLADRTGWSLLRRASVLTPLLVLLASAGGISAAIKWGGLNPVKGAIYGDRQLMAISPTALNSWEPMGADTRENAEVEKTLGTENYLTRTYRERGVDKPVRLMLHTAYYTSSIDTVPHVPERCMVGAGWQIDADPKLVPLTLDASRWSADPRDPAAKDLGYLRARTGERSDAPGRYVNLPKGIRDVKMQVTPFIAPNGQKLYAGYFFIANGQVATTAIDVRRMAFDITTKYAFYMKVQVSSPDVSSAEELAERASRLLDELLPELMRCAPDWLRVERGEIPKNDKSAGDKNGTKRAP